MLLTRLFNKWFFETWERINREAADERARFPGFDWRPVFVLILVSFILIFQEYYGDRPNFDQYVGRFFEGSRYYSLGSFAWWAGAKVLGYLIVPVLAVKLVLRGRLSDYGMSVRDFGKHAWIYVALFLAVLPAVVAASYTRPFQATYPFYKAASRSWTDFFLWESMYAASFMALEFFFRGFILFSLKRVMGAYAIFVMIVPYCMIHFHKPVAEVAGAIFAGIILGTLAMATRSIWFGVLIHVSVAVAMDLLAIAHTTGFPGRHAMGEYAP
jgi:membrane protease YdiL (CAAX protease family)